MIIASKIVKKIKISVMIFIYDIIILNLFLLLYTSIKKLLIRFHLHFYIKSVVFNSIDVLLRKIHCAKILYFFATYWTCHNSQTTFVTSNDVHTWY
jgi:hypothetical protein